VRFQFIAAEKARYPVRILCRCLGVTRSGFYAWQRRPLAPRRVEDLRLLHRLRLVHAIHRRLYGRPRLHRALRDDGIRIGEKRVRRLMREAGLTAQGRRAFRRTTDSAHAWPTASNLLRRQFRPGRPHQCWAADITALPTRVGWCYLAVILDLGSRRVVGWAVRGSLETELVLAAVHVALGARPAPHLHHSDRGSQYASAAYRSVLDRRGVTLSMSRVGNCWDNAPVESFFSSLKAELVSQARWTTHNQAEAAVADYLRFYNHQRLHSALDYRSPVQYEASFAVAV
jgi:transposase InsO family protein